MSKDGQLYEKFAVTRRDGTHIQNGKHHGCEYFVLDITHDPYALPALAAYATACRETHPTLADDLEHKIRERKENL